MATVTSLRARHDDIVAQFHANEPFVLEVQSHALEELLPVLQEELELTEVGLSRARAFLQDPVTVFRFCRRARFSLPASLALIHATLSFRLVSSLSNLTPATLAPLYLTQPVFFFHPSLSDRFGRPCAVLNLKYVTRTEDGELEGLKEFVRMGWEVGRRWMADSSKAKSKDGVSPEVKVQMVVIVDLEGAGMTNLEVELLPFFMDLLKSHFPGMVGAIFVLNYGWMYAGMWQLAKRILPHTALERILFPTKSELLQFFDVDHLLVEHGGTVSYEYTPANPILEKYCRPLPTLPSAAYPSPLPSPLSSSPLIRNMSLESLSDVFHSVAPTPFASRPTTPVLPRRPSGLSMTTLHRHSTMSALTRSPALTDSSEKGIWRTASSSSLSGLRRIPSLVDFQLHLAETQAAIQSDSSDEDEDEEEMEQRDVAAREYARQMSEAVLRHQQGIARPNTNIQEEEEEEEDEVPIASTSNSVLTSAYSSRATSRATSRNVSRAVSRETSPTRRRDLTLDLSGEIFASRAVKFTGNQVSPYNSANPYYGYPSSTLVDSSGIPRPHNNRRRKRDLIRTLTYLAALRFLALHRQIKRQIALLIRATLSITRLQNLRLLKAEPPKRKQAIRWEHNDGDAMHDAKGKGRATTAIPPSASVRGVKFVYVLLLLILVRSPLISNIANLVFVAVPKFVLPKRLFSSSDCAVLRGAGLGTSQQAVRRKRDVVKRMLGMATPARLVM